MEFKLGHLRQIALPSADLVRSIRFYRDSVGLEFIAEYPGLAFFRLGQTRLLLEHSKSGRPSDAVLYFEVADIDTTYAALMQRGINFDSAPHLIYRDAEGTFGQAGGEEWRAFFKDPDENVLALSSRKKLKFIAEPTEITFLPEGGPDATPVLQGHPPERE